MTDYSFYEDYLETEATFKEEQNLGSINLYMDDIRNCNLITPAEEIELGKRIAKGDITARNELCEANYRLVVKVAKEFKDTGFELIDLIQAGNMGLLHACEKFDYERGCHFSTYAVPWISQSIKRFIEDNGRTIRIPTHMHDSLIAQNKVINRLTQENGRKPSLEEIAEETGFSLEKVKQVQEIIPDAVSLDKMIGEDEDSSLSDFIASDESDSPEIQTMRRHMKEDIEKALYILPERERDVLRRRYGLSDTEEASLRQVSKELGVSAERVRQIERRALDALRTSAEAKRLKDYLSVA